MPEPLVLSGPRLADGRTVDVRLGGGRVEAVGTAGSLAGPGAARVELAGHLLLPAPAEPHAHHDTALTGAHPGPPAGGADGLRRRMTEAALIQLGHGATAQRTHVRTGDAAGLVALRAALATRHALRGLADLTAVATAGVLTGRAGADNRARLRDAAAMGAAALGCCPDIDPDPAGCLETVLGLADAHGLPVDLHTEGGDPARLARLAAAAGAVGCAVAIGPCAGLGRLPAQVAAGACDRLAAAGVTVICLPQGSCALAPGRPGPAATPVRLLRAAGVRVAAGGGALRDPANPVGRGDPLEAAFLLAARRACEPADAYAAIAGRARAAMGLPEVRVEAGFPGELLAVRGDSVAGALCQAYSRLVIHRGRIVARTSAVREFRGSPAGGGLELPRQATG
jgi:cytosine deaminase